MGYTTVFWGRVAVVPALDRGERRHLEQFAATRHEGPDVPGNWCQWVPTRDGAALQWDGREKFYFAPDIGQVATADGLRTFAADLAALHPNPQAFRAALG